MSRENVEAFKRGLAAYDRGDIDALLNELDADVEWQPVFPVLLGGETTTYRGHQGVRDLQQEVFEVFAEFHVEVSEIRDLGGDRVLASGRMRARGKSSGAETDSPLAYLVDFRNGKALRVLSFRDASEALEAIGLRE